MEGKKVKWGVLSIHPSSNEDLLAVFNHSLIADLVQHDHGHYEEIIHDPDVDAVYIRLPSNLRLLWALKAANAKKHVLCEEPAAINARDAAQVMKTCKDNKVLFMDSGYRIPHPQHTEVKHLIETGFIGDISMIKLSFSFPAGMKEFINEEWYCPVSDGLNSIRHILQREPLNIVALGKGKQNEAYQTIIMIFDYPGSIQALVDCSCDTMMRNEYEVIGTRGIIKLPCAYRPDLNGGDGVIWVQTENDKKEITIKGNRNLHSIEQLSECILQGNLTDNCGETQWKNTKIFEAIEQSLNNNAERTRIENKFLEDGWAAECGISSFLTR